MDNQKNDELEKSQGTSPDLQQRSFIGAPFLPTCQHCYCGQYWANGKEHVSCCMCGTRTLKYPVTF